MKIFIALLIFLIALWFYWFQYRPSMIRSNCDSQAKLSARVKYNKDNKFLEKDYDSYFRFCMNENGLKN